jgi:ribosome-associated translation inhibitor RaiA
MEVKMKNNIIMTKAQEDYFVRKIFSLMDKFENLRIDNVSVNSDGNIFEVIFHGGMQKKSIYASSQSYGFSSAVDGLRTKILSQVYNIRGKSKLKRRSTQHKYMEASGAY